MKKSSIRTPLILTILVLLAYSSQARQLRLATATSTENSGLLARILPDFTKQTGIQVQVIAVGTGKALKLGETGDVDVILVHAPAQERAFVDAGYGINHQRVMYNDFVLVGPSDNPANLRRASRAVEALTKIAATNSTFVSRGDESGTHTKEKALWAAAHIRPQGDWYRETGQGMGSVLQMANELGAYTLTDRGTWLAQQDKMTHLEILNEGDARLHNPYSVIAVNPARHRDLDHDAATRFIDWLTSPGTQASIGKFTIAGDVLFRPLAAPSTE